MPKRKEILKKTAELLARTHLAKKIVMSRHDQTPIIRMNEEEFTTLLELAVYNIVNYGPFFAWIDEVGRGILIYAPLLRAYIEVVMGKEDIEELVRWVKKLRGGVE